MKIRNAGQRRLFSWVLPWVCVFGGMLVSCIPIDSFASSLVITNGYGDSYHMNLVRDRYNYQAYRGSCRYRGFAMSGCSTTGEVVMLRIKETNVMPEHYSLLSTSIRWGTTTYVLNDLFRWLNGWTMYGYENWYPNNMSCSVAMYVDSGGFGLRGGGQTWKQQSCFSADMSAPGSIPALSDPFRLYAREADPVFDLSRHYEPPADRAWSLVITNGYGDSYYMNLVRDRYNYQAYRGSCHYRGFAMSGCSTTGEVVMLRIKETNVMPEHYSLVSTSIRWGTTTYFLNDVFRWLNSWTMYGYENWYPNNMSCSVAMYIHSGGLGLRPRVEPGVDRTISFDATRGAGTTNVIGVLLPLTGDLADIGQSYQAAYTMALGEIANTSGMPAIQLEIKDTGTDAAVACEKLDELYQNGVRIVLGPETSQECSVLREYADQNNMLLISSSSTASQLAITNDNLMRLAVEDSQQGKAIAELIHADGITDIAILSRLDMYGDGLRDALIAEFTALGGTVFLTNSCPRAPDFIGETITNISVEVAKHLELTSADKVGFVTILFDEGVTVMQNAASLSAFSSIRWYGADGMAQNSSLLTNTVAAALALQSHYVCSASGRYTNALYGVVETNIAVQVGSSAVPRYPMFAYDALWLTALALKETGGTQTVDMLKTTIRSIATNYSGATGPLVFNAADDRSTGTYGFWEFTDVNGSNQWLNIDESAPIAPGNVMAGDGSCVDRIRVSWNSVSGATGYEVWRGTSAESSLAQLLASGVVGTSCDDVSAALKQNYYYWIRATNSLGTSGFSVPDVGWRRGLAPGYSTNAVSDLTVFDSGSGNWYIRSVSGATIAWQTQWGWPGALPVSGDYNGDGVSDLAVLDGNSGCWYVKSLCGDTILWGQRWGWFGVVSAPGDYDGDGVSDLAVFDSFAGKWYIATVAGASIASGTQWGTIDSTPVAGDYDGDGVSDLAVFDTVSGRWYIKSLNGSVLLWQQQWGSGGWTPVPGDYNGDRIDDLAVFDDSSGQWYIMTVNGSLIAWAVQWGWPGACPVAGDFDGDGINDLAVFDTKSGYWYVRTLSGTLISWQVQWGWPGAVPVHGAAW